MKPAPTDNSSPLVLQVEHVIADSRNGQILRQCRRRGDAINHNLQIIAELWNIKTHNQLRVNT